MDLPSALQVVCRLVICLQIIDISLATKVYMDKFGHCESQGYFELEEGEFTLMATGGGIPHETLLCDMSFRARPEKGICLTFQKFYINDCSMNMKIFQSSSASGYYWRKIGCKDPKPSQMCSSERYVTIKLSKEKMNRNKNYDFEILITEGDGMTGEGVLFVSIGVYVGIIVGVVVLIAGLAILVICCCCKRRPNRRPGYQPTLSTGPTMTSTVIQPTAPPLEAHESLVNSQEQTTSSGLYPSLPQYSTFTEHEEPPPPYTPPNFVARPYELDPYPTKT